MSFCTTTRCLAMTSETSTPGQSLFDIRLPKNCTLRWRSRGRRKKKQTATQLTTSLEDVEEAPIAQPTDSQSVRVLAGSESSAENVTDELRPRTAAKNGTSVPETNHSASDGSMSPEDRLVLITDAKLILHDLSGDSTARVRVSQALLLLLGLCALVAVL
ncbi:trans-sialidase [Trypanosoma cruzi]|nr:trans-sialidase [Trypanosoma cruzi]